MKTTSIRFRDLTIGQTFDWVSGSTWDSFYLPCRKLSTRCYVDSSGVRHKVGSINAAVYHVDAVEVPASK